MIDCGTCHTSLPDVAKYCHSCGSDTTLAPPPEAGGDTGSEHLAELKQKLARALAGRYVVRELLGAGGMAAVFLADDLTLERAVAIKVLPPELARDERVVERFQREAKTAAKLDHPHIIPIYRVESENGLNYFVMKYVAGRSLESVLANEMPVSVEFAQRVLGEAASALNHAHQRGVVHRDVKPANIMLDAGDRAILTDFGISKAAESASQLTHTGTIVGTPYYMAPEQAKGLPVDGRADQYALAVVAYQLCTGQLLFTGESAHTILFQHIYDEAPRVALKRPDVPPHVDAAVAKALSKEAADRFATMEEFLAELRGSAPARVQSSSSDARVAPTARIRRVGSSVPTVPVARASSSRRRSPRRTALLGGVGALVVTGSAMVALRRSSGETVSGGGAPESLVVSSALVAGPDSQLAIRDSLTSTADSLSATLDSVVAVPKPQPSESVRLPAPKNSPPRKRVTPNPVVAQATARQVAMLTVVADPWGTVYVNGVEIGPSPVVDHELVVGNRYELRVEQEGFRTKREIINVTGPNAIRRRYILEPGGSE